MQNLLNCAATITRVSMEYGRAIDPEIPFRSAGPTLITPAVGDTSEPQSPHTRQSDYLLPSQRVPPLSFIPFPPGYILSSPR